MIYRKMNHGNAHLSIVQWIPKLTSLDLLDHLQIVPLVRESPLPGDCYDCYNLGKELVTLLYFKNLTCDFVYLLSLGSVIFLRPTKLPSSSRRKYLYNKRLCLLSFSSARQVQGQSTPVMARLHLDRFLKDPFSRRCLFIKEKQFNCE